MWKCLNCNEEIEDDFEVCWRCETGRDGTSLTYEESGINTEKAKAEPLTIVANLGHLDHTTYYSAIQHSPVGTVQWEEKYKVYRVIFHRPEKGCKTLSISCKFCGQEIPVKVASEAITTKKRILSFAIVIALVIYMYLVYANVRPGRITILEALLVTAAIFSIFAVMVNLKKLFKSEVDLALTLLGGDAQGSASHKFFDPRW